VEMRAESPLERRIPALKEHPWQLVVFRPAPWEDGSLRNQRGRHIT
jgi:hypothetical protein